MLLGKHWPVPAIVVGVALAAGARGMGEMASAATAGSIAAMDQPAVSPAAVGLRIDWTVSPAVLRPGAPVTVGYRVVDVRSGGALTTLPLDHERPMHLITVSRNLALFQHIHPHVGRDGTWRVQTTLGPAGTYVLYDEFVHNGLTVLDCRQLVVGHASPGAPLSPDLAPKTVDGVTVALQTPGTIWAGREAHFIYRLTSGGRPLTDLSPYLGAAAHIAIVSEDTRSFAHTHGEVGSQGAMGGMDMPVAPARFGPSIAVNHTFPHAGLYKIWAQFGYRGRVLTVPFVMQVR